MVDLKNFSNFRTFIALGVIATIAGGIAFTYYTDWEREGTTVKQDSVNLIKEDYKKLLERLQSSSLKNELLSLCSSKENFDKKIKEIKKEVEEELQNLNRRKVEYITKANEEWEAILEEKRIIYTGTVVDGSDIGAACPRDYDGQIMLPGSWPTRESDGKPIPPAYWPPDLDGVVAPPGWPKDSQGNPLPPGVCARDYNGELMVNGSWELDFDGNLVPPSYWPKDSNGRVLPPPGWPLDELGRPLPPGSLKEPAGYMESDVEDDNPPSLEDESIAEDDFDLGKVIKENLEEMLFDEEMIRIELDSLDSICENNKQKEQKEAKKEKKVPSDCQTACQKFSQCSIVTGGNAEDKQDDYKICMQECVSWKEETRICINKKEPTNIQNCDYMALCIGQEIKYNKGINPGGGYIIDNFDNLYK